MSDQKQSIPFDLESFKNGQSAIGKDSVIPISFLAVSSHGYIIYEYESEGYDSSFGNSTLAHLNKWYVMVSRHQAFIDSYDPEDTWQSKHPCGEYFVTLTTQPDWDENFEYRIHPHNHLIKAHKKGAKIQVFCDKLECFVDCTPFFDEDKVYRIKSEHPNPIYKKLINDVLVLKFHGLTDAEVIVPNHHYNIGDRFSDFNPHTANIFEDWTPPTITVPFPPLPFSLTCGDKPEVRRWLKDNGCKWSRGQDIVTNFTTEFKLNVDSRKLVTFNTVNKCRFVVFNPFNQSQPEPPEPTIHCLVYDAARLTANNSQVVRTRVCTKQHAIDNCLRIIQEWEV